jgi:uroporphyrinogen-III synthase
VKKEELDDFLEPLKNGEVLVAVIGPVTAKPLEERGIPIIIPDEYTVKAMLNRLREEFSNE